jgi:branched-subunit amino acid transport protein
MSFVVVVAAAAALTWGIRVTGTILLPPERLPGTVQRALVHAGPAVMAVLAVRAVLGGPHGVAGVRLGDLVGLAVAAGVARRWGHLGAAVVSAIAVAAVLRLAVGA